ncbi:MAG TPA: ABC-F family ATP-binding cassette domain-containing protein [Alphaproteobacteria bacterium]|nr:ABC-F family ATP-binding cassette domain-containing protein [Alphaproteobacteria bacterium]
MELVRFSNLDCHYGAREIFTGLSGVLQDGERVGLVGPNGAGKSSLLRLLAGIDPPSAGSVSRARDATFAYLAQSVADETESTLQELIDAALARATPETWGMRNKTLHIMLAAFGFREEAFSRPLREFSGGQRAKAALAHVLIEEPDYCIFDEPTNHLDIETVRWLESYIASDKRAYIIVSHDRYFLNRVATRIWEIEAGRLHVYAPAANAYDAFVAQRALRHDEERRAYEAFIAEREKRRATIAGLRATHTSSDYSQVRSREKQLARAEARLAADAPAAPAATIAVNLKSTRGAASAFALEITGLSKAYARPLFEDLDVDVLRGERLAIVGPNGSGKSTLLKIVSGDVAADRGTVRLNPASQIAYFAQNSHEQLDPLSSAVEAVRAGGDISDQAARSLLGRMRISGDAADKAVRTFSGGERRRIMLASLMAKAADVLLLDEPTNDLDIDSREALEAVLGEYEGAILIVSHDRYLLSRLCDRVLWIDGGTWGVLEGGYDSFEAVQAARDAAAPEKPAAPLERTKSSRLTPLKIRSQLETRIAGLEREIAKLDARKAEIDQLFMLTQTYDDRQRVAALESERARLADQSEEHLATWESLHAQLEALG